ncbi:hypothetical protein SDC9_56027 [bioreactor metagenome]|uniref:Uncharacterized protein n=1 Tax=bioreactor metagenome TaxID=1076179 RepID=A0A644X0M7_9ZZZZ
MPALRSRHRRPGELHRPKLRQRGGRDQHHLAVGLAHEGDAGLAACHFAALGFFDDAEHQVEAVAIEVRRRHADAHDLAVEAPGFILGHDVTNDKAHVRQCGLGKADFLKEAQPRLGDQAEQLRVVQVPALIHVADVDLHLGAEGEVIGQFKDDAGHGQCSWMERITPPCADSLEGS